MTDAPGYDGRLEDFDGRSVVEELQDDADEWDVLAVDLASEAEDGRVLFLLVIRRKVSDDGHLLLSERYYRYDLVDREGTWLSNGIERRVSGALSTALKVLYSALDDGALDPDDPMLIDSRDHDGLSYDPADLSAAVDALRGDRETGGEAVDRDPRLRESGEGRTTETVTCDECGGEVARRNALNMGGALGIDLWVCEEQHVAQDDSDDGGAST